MRGTNNTPAAGGPGRSRRPGFSYEIRLVGGEAGRRLEREQAQAVAEVLGWLAANAGSVDSAAARVAPRAGSGAIEPAPGEVVRMRGGWGGAWAGGAGPCGGAGRGGAAGWGGRQAGGGASGDGAPLGPPGRASMGATRRHRRRRGRAARGSGDISWIAGVPRAVSGNCPVQLPRASLVCPGWCPAGPATTVTPDRRWPQHNACRLAAGPPLAPAGRGSSARPQPRGRIGISAVSGVPSPSRASCGRPEARPASA
jgi:hypothetical protein